MARAATTARIIRIIIIMLRALLRNSLNATKIIPPLPCGMWTTSTAVMSANVIAIPRPPLFACGSKNATVRSTNLTSHGAQPSGVQFYGDWEEIQPPRRSACPCQPHSKTWIGRASPRTRGWSASRSRKPSLKAITPDIPVTTNFMGFHKGVDYFEFAAHEDVVSKIVIPTRMKHEWPAKAGMVCDLIRSVGTRRPWILMEQATSQVNWRQRNVDETSWHDATCEVIRRARGADGIMFSNGDNPKRARRNTTAACCLMVEQIRASGARVKALGNELPNLMRFLPVK